MKSTVFMSALLCLGSPYILLVAASVGLHNTSIPQLPPCAVSCLYDAFKESGCTPKNQTCVCGTLDVKTSAVTCSRAECSVIDSLETHRFIDKLCNEPERDLGPPIRALCWLGAFLSTLFVIVRMLCKVFVDGPSSKPTIRAVRADDLALLLTYFAAIPVYVIVGSLLVDAGLGQDVWTLEPDHIDDIGYWLYVAEPVYVLVMMLLKTSFLLFFLHIFCRGQAERFCCRGWLNLRHTLWATIVGNAMAGVTFMMALLFQCTPVSYTWTRWPGVGQNDGGTCINVKAVVWSHSAVSIAFDAWMLYLPLSQIRSMNLPLGKKIYVALMFCVGAFVSVVTILRLQTLSSYGNTVVDPTWDYYPSAIWSVMEFTVGIICACMPAARIALLRSLPGSVRPSSTSFTANTTTATNRASKQSHFAKFSLHSKSRSSQLFSPATSTFGLGEGERPGMSSLRLFLHHNKGNTAAGDSRNQSEAADNSATTSEIEELHDMIRKEPTTPNNDEEAITPVSEALKDIIRDSTMPRTELSPVSEVLMDALREEQDSAAVAQGGNSRNSRNSHNGAPPTRPVSLAGRRRTSDQNRRRRITPDFFIVPAIAGGAAARGSLGGRKRALSSPRSPTVQRTTPAAAAMVDGFDWAGGDPSVTELADPNALARRERDGEAVRSPR